jgi:hypothetical protein
MTLPHLPPPPPTALRAGQHLPDVNLEVFPFHCPVPVDDLVIVIVVVFVIVIFILVIIIIVVILARLCPIVILLPPINPVIIPLVILY